MLDILLLDKKFDVELSEMTGTSTVHVGWSLMKQRMGLYSGRELRGGDSTGLGLDSEFFMRSLNTYSQAVDESLLLLCQLSCPF